MNMRIRMIWEKGGEGSCLAVDSSDEKHLQGDNIIINIADKFPQLNNDREYFPELKDILMFHLNVHLLFNWINSIVFKGLEYTFLPLSDKPLLINSRNVNRLFLCNAPCIQLLPLSVRMMS